MTGRGPPRSTSPVEERPALHSAAGPRTIPLSIKSNATCADKGLFSMKPDRNMKLADLMYGHGSEYVTLNADFDAVGKMQLDNPRRRPSGCPRPVALLAVIRPVRHSCCHNHGVHCDHRGHCAERDTHATIAHPSLNILKMTADC